MMLHRPHGRLKAVIFSALSRTTPELTKNAKYHCADIYIAHNLGALPAAIEGARFNCGKAILDLEDYYTGMAPKREKVTSMQYLMSAIEDRYVPACDGLFAASDGIGEIYFQRYGIKPTTVLNVFPLALGVDSISHSAGAPLRLFWFSQTIGGGRGLEDVLKAMAQINRGDIELHLLGSWQEGYRDTFLRKAEALNLCSEKVIFSHPPRFPDDIPKFAAQFDIGLALEIPDSENRDLCLTNKIFTYLLAGNAVIATETKGQKGFLDSIPSIGFTYAPGDDDRLARILKHLLKSPEALKQFRCQSFKQGRTRFHWEREQKLLLDEVLAQLGLADFEMNGTARGPAE